MTIQKDGPQFMKILFSRRNNIGSWLIRLVTWSEWSHVEILNNGLIGANAPEGVLVTSYTKRYKTASEMYIMNIPCDDDKAIKWAYTQIGKQYDWFGVLGLWWHRNWQDDRRWWCSEFVAMALKVGGNLPFDTSSIKRITPQHLWMLDFVKEKVLL
jgi:uncharacterized protein YycO